MLLPIGVKFKYNAYIFRTCVFMSLDMSLDDSDELAYLWTKVKFIQKYMSKHNCSYEVAEREFHIWIEGLMDSRIERANKMLNSH
jgi:hypothetical protein